LKSGHLAGAAVDVYPQEPETNIKVKTNKHEYQKRIFIISIYFVLFF